MFKDTRVPFLVRQNRVIVGKQGEQDASAWAASIGYPRDVYNQSIRGWFIEGRIQLIYGPDNGPVPLLNGWLLCKLVSEHGKLYGAGLPRIFNGVIPENTRGIWAGLEEVYIQSPHIT